MGRRKSGGSPTNTVGAVNGVAAANGSATGSANGSAKMARTNGSATATPNGAAKYNLRKRRGPEESDEDVAAMEATAEEKPLPKKQRLAERTDRTRWRMRNDESRHTWHYLEDDEAAKAWPQTYADKYYLGLPLVCQRPAARPFEVSCVER